MAQRQQPPTRSGLLPEAAQFVLPKGIVSTAYPATEATCSRIGIEFDPWQRDLNKCILAKASSGLYAADMVGLSISRQVGKTFDVGALVFADCIINPGTTTVWTAHRFKVSRESFNEQRGWAKSPKLRPHIEYDDITTAAGNECIPFRNGSRIVFAARERGAIRGFTKVRRLILDEAQILTDAALADLAPTQNQADNPQIILMGTPPKPTDPSEVFTRIRAEALGGVSSGVLWVEFAAPRGSDPDDRDALKKANPSYPSRTPLKAIQRLRKLLSVEDYLREVFGIWDDDAVSDLINYALYEAGELPGPVAAVSAYSVEVNMDRSFATIGVAGTDADGRDVGAIHKRAPGTSWVLAECLAVNASASPSAFVVDSGGPAGSMINDMEMAGLTVHPIGTGDVAKACGWLVDHMQDMSFFHIPHPDLDLAVRNAQPRPIGDGAFAFGRKVTTGADVTPLNAVAFAALGHLEFGVGTAGAWQL